MKLDENFEPSADEYSLPDGLLERIEGLWKGLHKIVVEKKNKKSWKKVNAFSIADTAKSGTPSDDPEEAATLIIAIAATDVEDEGEEGTYRARFYREVNGKPDRDKKFTFRQGFGDQTESSFDASDPSSMHMLGIVFTQITNHMGSQQQHIENLIARMLERDQASTKQIEQLLKTNETIMGQFNQGLVMQANALTHIMDVERGLESDRQRGENTRALLDIMKKALPTALTQFGRYMRKKAGEEEDEEDEDNENEDGEETDDNDDEKESSSSDDDEDEQLKKDLKTKPLTTFAHAFKASITDDQWLGLGETLTKNQFKALKEAVTQDNDNDTAEGILKLYTAILKKPEKLLELQEVLSEKQVQMVLRLSEKATEYQEKMEKDAKRKKAADAKGNTKKK